MEYPQTRTESTLFQVGRNICAEKKARATSEDMVTYRHANINLVRYTSSQAGSTGLRMENHSGFAHFLSRFHPLRSTLCYSSLLAGLKANSGLSPHATSTVSDTCLVFIWIVFVWKEDFSSYWFSGSNQTFELLYLFQVKFQSALLFSKMMNSLWQRKRGYF